MMYTSQFLSRNQNEIMEVFNLYRDLIHDFDWYVLYIDKDCWELFDPNCGKAIFSHKYRHLKSLREDLLKFRRDLVLCGVLFQCASTNVARQPKSTERWAYKALRKVYTDDELINLYNIKKNESLNKIKNLADCD